MEDFKETFRQAKSARGQVAQQQDSLSSRQAVVLGGDEGGSMPPPPPRVLRPPSAFHEDSQATQLKVTESSNGEASVSNRPTSLNVSKGNSNIQTAWSMKSDKIDHSKRYHQSYSGPQEGETKESVAGSNEDGATLPAGFFEVGQGKSKRLKQSVEDKESDFDAFMEDISMIGSSKDAKRSEMGIEAESSPTDAVSKEDGSDDSDTYEFQQFVREERMREIKSSIHQRTAPGTADSEVSNALEIAGVAPETKPPSIRAIPSRKSASETYQELIDGDSAGESSAEDDDSDDAWRKKGL